MRKKKLKELTIKDNFMFGAVMSEEENCRGFLELLGIPVKQLTIDKEKSLVYHPEYKGVRLDVVAKDDEDTHYNIEMQVLKRKKIGYRSRYYHSQIDMELLLSGLDYTNLPNSYVIFICDFDPCGRGKYCYTFTNTCREVDGLCLEDGSATIFLSTRGTNDQEVPKGLVRFLKFVKASLQESTEDYEDDYVKQLQESVERIKTSREMGERYMTLEEWMADEREMAHAEGLAQGLSQGLSQGLTEGQARLIIRLLEEKGEVAKWLKEQILQEKDEDRLIELSREAFRAISVEQFVRESKSV